MVWGEICPCAGVCHTGLQLYTELMLAFNTRVPEVKPLSQSVLYQHRESPLG